MTCNCGSTDFGYGFGGCTAPQSCAPHYPAVRKNFFAPTAGTELIIEVTDTSMLWIGQSIRIGEGYYTVVDIVSSVRATIRHDGLGLTPGTQVVAREPTTRCYQYPIRPAGIVLTEFEPSIGLFSDTATLIAETLTPTLEKYQWSMIGPNTAYVDIVAAFPNTAAPVYVGIQMPVTPNGLTTQSGVLSAQIQNPTTRQIGITTFGTGSYADWLLVGRNTEAAYSASSTITVRVNGTFQGIPA